MEYVFTLRFRANNLDCGDQAFMDRLFEAGCGDALVSIGNSGTLALEFAREADGASEAVESAMADARKVVGGAELLEVIPS
ncbi:hypothetical protein [Salinisphaera sp. T31B1]|uniref:hypothetical protein n=1 Tax=Salinisphaera sp. T31B1 TaxID=727963 RepID=UPI00333E3F48